MCVGVYGTESGGGSNRADLHGRAIDLNPDPGLTEMCDSPSVHYIHTHPSVTSHPSGAAIVVAAAGQRAARVIQGVCATTLPRRSGQMDEGGQPCIRHCHCRNICKWHTRRYYVNGLVANSCDSTETYATMEALASVPQPRYSYDYVVAPLQFSSFISNIWPLFYLERKGKTKKKETRV